MCFARQTVAGNRWITQRGDLVGPVAVEEIPLPDPATLSLADDFSVVLRAKVPEALKRQAMRQLFEQPHFNVVDGLNVYMEDFNAIPEFPRDELALPRHAREVLDPTPQQALRQAQAAASSNEDDGALVGTVPGAAECALQVEAPSRPAPPEELAAAIAVPPESGDQVNASEVSAQARVRRSAKAADQAAPVCGRQFARRQQEGD